MTKDLPASPDWRGLCEELLDELLARPLIPDRALIDRARALLAQAEPEVAGADTDAILALAAIIREVDGNHSLGAAALAEAILSHPGSRCGRPAPAPVEAEVAELALKELERTMVLLMPVTGKNKIKRFDTIRAALKRLHELENKADLSPAPPAPKPADGEVGELVADLRMMASQAAEACQFTDAENLSRAAALLEQRHPAPVPVAERLPGPEDCDAEGFCWWFNPGQPAMSNPHIATSSWRLCRMLNGKPMGTHCLPATALPLPSVEVEHD